MTLRDAAALSAGSLIRSPVRTLLTILGLGVGIGAILTVITLGGAGQTQVETEIAKLGVDKVWISADADSTRQLEPEDSALAAMQAGADVCAGAGTISSVSLGTEMMAAQVAGYDAGMDAVHQPTLTEGRLFTHREHEQGAAVALADESLAKALGGDVCGESVFVGARSVRIVGVIRDRAVQLSGTTAGTIILPLSTFMDTFTGAAVSEMTVSIPAGASADEIAGRVTGALGRKGGMFRASSLQEEIDAARSVIRIFVMVLACVAAVCMLTGSIGVMNILLVSVRERRKEIGLIKAVGGTSGQVGMLFLLESIGYTLLGCLLGLALGVVMIRLFGAWIGLDAQLSPAAALPAMAAAGILGIVFGVAPALRAARLAPVEAFRGE